MAVVREVVGAVYPDLAPVLVGAATGVTVLVLKKLAEDGVAEAAEGGGWRFAGGGPSL